MTGSRPEGLATLLVGPVLVLLGAGCGGGPADAGIPGGTAPPVAPGIPPFALTRLDVETRDPVHIASPPGDDRLFVVEQAGRVRVIRRGSAAPDPFLDVSERVGSGGERGLLSVAFHPRFASNGTFFLYLTDSEGDSRVERWSVSADPERADPASARLILAVDQPFANHNGGHLLFGPDGFLYVTLGDGGSGGDPHGNGQDRTTLLGAILRLDVDDKDTYAIPPDNPYAGHPSFRPEIWAWGLRNPWRIAFDPGPELLFVADVGQNRREEIDVVPAGEGGRNFGWNAMEGSECFTARCDPSAYVAPTVEYAHSQGCSVTGGSVYRGAAIPELEGHYIYSDYCEGWLRSFRYEAGRAVDHRAWEVASPGRVVSFGTDGSGELYVVSRSGIFRLDPAPRAVRPGPEGTP